MENSRIQNGWAGSRASRLCCHTALFPGTGIALRVCLFFAVLLSSPWLLRADVCAMPDAMRSRLRINATAETYSDLGIWFANQKNYSCAANAFGSSLSLHPESSNVAFMFGLSLLLSGNAQDAVPALQIAERLDSHNVKAPLFLGAAFDQLQRITDAEAAYHTALMIDPQASDALDHLSDDLILDRDYAQVINLLENRMIVGQRTATQSLNLGSAYAATKNLIAATAVLQDGLNTSPDSLPIANELLNMLVEEDQSDEAAEVLDLILELHASELEAEVVRMRGLAAVYPANLERLLRRLPQTCAHSWSALYLAGLLERDAGRANYARAALEQSIALKPDYPESHAALGSIFLDLKDAKAAKREFTRAILLGDHSVETSKALEKAEEGLNPSK
jgi:tetratricopeptide (TPR) repeat protein